MKKQRADKTISLNEQQRIQEKKEAEARIETRKKERDARPVSTDKVFLVKTETVDKNQPLIAVTPPKPGSAAAKNLGPVLTTKAPTPKTPSPIPAKKETKAPEDAEEPEDTTDAGKAIIDVYLRETLSILGDYARQQAKNGRGEVVIVPR